MPHRAHRGVRSRRRIGDRRPRRASRSTAARRAVPTRTRRRATAGVASPTSRSASITRWRSESAGKPYVLGGYTVSGRDPAHSLRARERGMARASAHAVPARSRGRRRRRAADRRRRRNRRGPPARPERARLRPAHAALVDRPGPDAPRASGRDVLRRHRLRGRRVGRPVSTRTSCTSSRCRPGDRALERLQPIPDPRGGTGAAALAGSDRLGRRRGARRHDRGGARVPDRGAGAGSGSPTSPTPRHGVGVAALGGRVYVIGGGPEPGLTVSSANESLEIAG